MTCDYPVVPIRDAFHVDGLEHYSKLTNEIGKQVQTVGADLLVTNPKGIKKAIGEKTCSTLLIKMHQAATITECNEAVKLCKEAGWRVVVASHGSGEVFQDSVADLSVGLGSDQIMVGHPYNSIRRDTYKRLGEIEGEHRCANAGSKSPVPCAKP